MEWYSLVHMASVSSIETPTCGDRSVPRRVALIAALAALALRVGVALALGPRLFWSDEDMYLSYARRVSLDQWLGPRAFTFVPPGQHYTLGILFHLIPVSALDARLILAVASAASVWLTYRLAQRVSPWAGAVAACLMTLYPLVAYTAATLYPQTLAQFYLLCGANLLADHLERPSPGRVAGAGLFVGLTALTVPTILTICPALGAWMWWVRGRSFRAVAEVLLLAAVVTTTLAPWIYRNYRVEHRFIPIATVGSQIFFFANNPKADPDSKDIALVDSVYTPEIKAEIARSGNPDEVYSRHASDFIREQPGRFLLFYARRLRHFYDFTPHTFSTNSHTGRFSALVVGLTSGPVLLLALLGAVPWLRRGGIAAFVVLLPLLWSLASAVFGVTIRYRVPIEPCILVVASWSALTLAARFMPAARRALGVA